MTTAGGCGRCVLCDPPSREFGDAWVHSLLRKIRAEGWAVVGVAEDGDFPGWSYTVGLTHAGGGAELAMFGLDVEDMQHWVRTLAGAVETLPEEGPLDRAVLGLPAYLRPMDPSWYEAVFGVAHNFYRGTGFRVRQVVWGDRSGRYPWDDGVLAESRRVQPAGWLPAARAAGPWPEILDE